jgi:ABC-2 type transport system ATP-binding protein
MGWAFEGRGLYKTFKKKRSLKELARHPFGKAEKVRALRGVDLRVEHGEILGLLGPNGAGKTTLLKIFSCLVLPDEGDAQVDGAVTTDEGRVKRHIGLVNSDERSFYWRLSGRENLRFFSTLYDVPRSLRDARIDELLERVDLTEAADRPFSDYSSGMKQRMAVTRALLHDPPFLLLDEPTRSLDPAASLALRRFIKDELNGRDGKTILLASHDLHEVEALANRVTFLVKGRVRLEGTVRDIRRWGVEGEKFELELVGADGPLRGPFRVIDDEQAGTQRRVKLLLESDTHLDATLRALLDRGISVRSCTRLEPDLEEAFSRILASEEQQIGEDA